MEHSFDVEEARQFGVDAAIIIRHLRYWILKNRAAGKHRYDGRTWTYMTQGKFVEIFPYFTRRQIQRILTKLSSCEPPVILKGEYNPHPHDRTSWYAFYDEASMLPGTGQTVPSSAPNGRQLRTKRCPAAHQTVRSGLVAKESENFADNSLPDNDLADPPLVAYGARTQIKYPDKYTDEVPPPSPPHRGGDAEGEEKQASREADPIPYDEIAAHYNETVRRHADDRRGRLMDIRTDRRLKHLRARWQEELFRQHWRKVFDLAAEIPFMRRGSRTHPNFRGDFDWLIANDTNYVKVLEGRYTNRSGPPPEDDDGIVLMYYETLKREDGASLPPQDQEYLRRLDEAEARERGVSLAQLIRERLERRKRREHDETD